jgi:hypothetical protein
LFNLIALNRTTKDLSIIFCIHQREGKKIAEGFFIRK